MSRASCVVHDRESKLVYDRMASDLSGLTKDNFRFNITSENANQDVALFQMVRGEEVLRHHRSEPFPKGALQLKNIKSNQVSCIVELKKKSPIDLNDFFTN